MSYLIQRFQIRKWLLFLIIRLIKYRNIFKKECEEMLTNLQFVGWKEIPLVEILNLLIAYNNWYSNLNFFLDYRLDIVVERRSRQRVGRGCPMTSRIHMTVSQLKPGDQPINYENIVKRSNIKPNCGNCWKILPLESLILMQLK